MSAYVFTLDGLAFATEAKFFRGPAIYHQPQKWVEMDFIGNTAVDATGLMFTGLSSQKWKCGRGARFTSTEKDKLLSVYNGRTAVVFKTPQDSTGVNVIMTELEIEYEEPNPRSLYGCTFTLVRRA